MKDTNIGDHLLAITIGPIYNTVLRAKKTRELWAGSFIFSLLMRELLAELYKKKDWKIIMPEYTEENANDQEHGAGIWPDRCIISIGSDNPPDIDNLKDTALENIASYLDFQESLSRFFQVYAMSMKWSNDQINDKEKEDEQIVIHRVNRLLDNLELRSLINTEEDAKLIDVLDGHIYELYLKGYNPQGDKVFISLPEQYGIRLPSIPEIALRSFRHNHPEEYFKFVEEEISRNVIEYKKATNRGKLPEPDSEKANEAIYAELKSNLGKKAIRLNHKYYALVKADGDNLGKIITAISKENGDIAKFSGRLRSFSKKAVKEVVEYGGLPIFAGGDDLLIMAPVLSGNIDCPDIFTLCKKLDELFQDSFDSPAPTLSFGISINYYKFPLGEALAKAYELEKKAKSFEILQSGVDKPVHKKNALSFEVRKHSGHQFGATIWLGARSFTEWSKLLSSHSSFEESFMTSIMHDLQGLPSLLADACQQNTLDDFFDLHFNEIDPSKKGYLKQVKYLTKTIWEEYGDFLSKEYAEFLAAENNLDKRQISPVDWHKSNILFASLRFFHFIIQDDHD